MRICSPSRFEGFSFVIWWEHVLKYSMSEFVRQESSMTNLSEGLSPDAGAHFDNSSGSLLQQAHVAPEGPALGIRTGLQRREKVVKTV